MALSPYSAAAASNWPCGICASLQGSRLEVLVGGLLVLIDLEDHLVQVGLVLTVVIGELFHHDLLLVGPAHELEGAGSHRVLAEVLATVLLHHFLGNGGEDRVGGVVDEVRVGIGEGDLQGVVVKRLHTLERGGRLLLVELLEALDGGHVVGYLAGRGGVADAVPGIHEVLCRALPAVVKLDPFLQVEGEHGGVIVHLVGLGHGRYQLHGLGVVVHQAIEDLLPHLNPLGFLQLGWIQRHGVGDQAVIEDAPFLDLLRLLFLLLFAASSQGHGQPHEEGHDQDHDEDNTALFHARPPWSVRSPTVGGETSAQCLLDPSLTPFLRITFMASGRKNDCGGRIQAVDSRLPAFTSLLDSCSRPRGRTL